MKHMKIKCLCLLAALLLPGTAMAGKSGRCDDKKPGSDRSRDNRSQNAPWRGEVSPEEMQAALKLYQDHSKRRWEEYSKLEPEQQKKVGMSMLGTYRMLRFFTRNGENQALWTNKTEQIQIEDDIFGYRMDLLKAEADEPARNRLQEQIKAKIGELVDKRMKEKSMRIASLERSLKDETDKLAQDMLNRQALIDEIYERELSRKPAIVNDNRRPPDREGEKDK